MGKIILETFIKANPGVCFDLSLDVDKHVESATGTGERAIAGVMSGMMKLHDEVTWEARHFGVRQRLTIKIVDYERPAFFKDIQVRGIFKSFEHSHFFKAVNNGTLMRDEMIFCCPMGILGWMADKVVERHLRSFLLERNQVLKKIAEQISDTIKE